MAAQNAAAVLGTEMETVRKKLPVLFERDDVLYSKIEKREVQVISDRDMRIPLEINPGGLYGAFDPNGGDMGRGTGINYDKAVINTNYRKMAVEATKQAQWATDDARKAIINTFRQGLAKAMPEFRRNIEAELMTDGTGVVGTVSAVSTSGGKDTITLNTAGDGFNAKLLRDRGSYSIYNAALTTRRTFTGVPSGYPAGEAPIDLHDLANKQVRFNGTTGATIATDVVVISGITSTPPVGFFGLPYHHNSASSGQWLGLDRSTVPQIRANSVAAGGGLTLPLARVAMNKVGDRVGINEIPKMIAFMHPCQKQAYEELGQLAVIIQKQARAEGLNMYFNDDMQMAGAPVQTSFFQNKTRIDFLVLDVWGRAEAKAPDFYEEDGVKIFPIRGSSGGVAAASLYYLFVGMNFFVSNPAVCTYISGLSIPVGY